MPSLPRSGALPRSLRRGAALCAALLLSCPALLRAQALTGPGGIEENAIQKTIWVDSAVGNDTTGDGSPGAPYATFVKGFSEAVASSAYRPSSGWTNPVHTRLVLKAGVYAESVKFEMDTEPLANAKTLVIERDPAAPTGSVVITGSAPASSGWTEESAGSGVWWRPWTANFGVASVAAEESSAGLDTVGRTRDLAFVNGKLLERKWTKAELRPGAFWVDESDASATANRVYVQLPPGVNPNTAAVRLSDWRSVYAPANNETHLLWIGGKHKLVLRGLVFEHASGSIKDHAVRLSYRRWNSQPRVQHVLVENCVFRWNGGNAGLLEGRNFTVRHCQSTDNGANGFGTAGWDSVLEDSVFARNNWRDQWDNYAGWNTANLKLAALYNVQIRRCSFTDGFTFGLWLDVNCKQVLVDDCDFHRNGSSGLFIEISPGPITVSNSRATLNGRGGVSAFQSSSLTIRNNVLSDNAAGGIEARTGQRIMSGAEPPSVTDVNGAVTVFNDLHSRDWLVENNTITGRNDSQGLFVNVPSAGATTTVAQEWDLFRSTLTARDNTYRHDAAEPFTVGLDTANAPVRGTFARWQALVGSGGAGLDTSGSTLSAPAAAPRVSGSGQVEVQAFPGLGGRGSFDADPFLNLALDDRYQDNSPAVVSAMPAVATPANADQRGATVVTGWIQPPVSGEYRFYLAGDYRAQFRLDTGGGLLARANISPASYDANLVRVANWDAAAERASAPVSLVAGQSYAFEIVALGYVGRPARAELGWMRPASDTGTGHAREIVPAAFITPYATPEPATGGILREFWFGVPHNVNGALEIADLQAYADFQANRPTGRNRLARLESVHQTGGNYGERLRGYIVPFQTGQYRFWLAGAFRAWFTLSSDESPANLRTTDFTDSTGNANPQLRGLGNGYKVWNHREHEQKSVLVPMTAGRPYYFEVLHTNHDSGGHVEVSWAKPAADGSNVKTAPDEIIPGSALLPWSYTLPVITSTTSLNVTVGQPVSYAITATESPVRYSAANLPAGLSFNEWTGTLSGTPSASGTYVIALGAINGAGTGTATLTLNVAALSQTISFAALANKTYGDASFALSATASSGLPVSFVVVSGPATLSGSTLTITGTGSVTVRATQAGNATYSAAAPVDRAFTVAKAPLTLTIANATRAYGLPNPAFTGTWSGWKNGDTAAVLASPPAYACSATPLSPVGAYPITASGAAAANYTVAYVPGTLSVTALFSEDFASSLGQWTAEQGVVGTNFVLVQDGGSQRLKVVQNPAQGHSTLRLTSGQSSWTNYTIELTMKVTRSGANSASVLARYQGLQNWYSFAYRHDVGRWGIGKRVGSTMHNLVTSAPYSLPNNTEKRVRCVVNGSTLQLWILEGSAWVKQCELTDTQYASGKVGLSGYDVDVIYEDVVVTN